VAAGSWNFITNHFRVLAHISQSSDSTGLEIARAIGISERTVREIIGDLQRGGYVELARTGRRNQYRVNDQQLLGLRGNRELATVGDLLELLKS